MFLAETQRFESPDPDPGLGEQDAPLDTAELRFEDVGFTSVDRVHVRDLIGRRDLGVQLNALDVAAQGPLGAAIPGHGLIMLNLTVVW